MARLKVTQVRSTVGKTRRMRETVRALGLMRIRHSVVKDDRPEIRGMIARVGHLVEVEEVQ
jgi:ribosomal protein L30